MSHPGRLRHRVGEAVVQGELWMPGQRVAVAVSGGLDSVVLLDVLVATQRWHGAQLSVVHIDHGVRAGSALDAAFVKERAESYGLPVHHHRCEGLASDEASLRHARHAVFDAVDVDRVALGHHRDDQAETLLLQLLRGAGSRGARGMLARRGKLVRPLLKEPRSALLDWAQTHALSWREDPSNTDPTYLRNRVRHELMPLLESLRSGASEVLARSAGHLAEDEAALQDQVQALADTLSVVELSALPPALSRRWLQSRWPQASSTHLDALLGLARGQGSRVELPGGLMIEVMEGRLRGTEA